MKIFRKIRFDTLFKKNFGKYLTYAIGEIVLVVFGILIALYLNGKKENVNNQERQRNHLILIKEELEKNLTTLTEEEVVLSEIISNIQELSNLMSSGVSMEQLGEANLSSLLFLPISRSIDVDYENVAYTEFIASNSLKDIKNDSLRTLLRSWDRRLQTLKMQEKVVQKSLYKTGNFIEVHGSLKTVFDNYNLSESYLGINNSSTVFSNKLILESRQFENILLQYLGVATQLHNTDYPSFKSDIEVLMALIQNKLNED